MHLQFELNSERLAGIKIIDGRPVLGFRSLLTAAHNSIPAVQDSGLLLPLTSILNEGETLFLCYRFAPQSSHNLSIYIGVLGQLDATHTDLLRKGQLEDDMEFVLSSGRTGLRFSATALPDRILQKPSVNIRPVGLAVEGEKAHPVEEQGKPTRLMRQVVRLLAPQSGSFVVPLEDLSAANCEFDLVVSMEAFELSSDNIEIVASAIRCLEAEQAELWKAGMLSQAGGEDLEPLLARQVLRQWRRCRRGLKISLQLASDAELPNSVLELATTSFWGRSNIARGPLDRATVAATGALDLANCISLDCRTAPTLPSPISLQMLGFPIHWPSVRGNLSTTGVSLGVSGKTTVQMSESDRLRHLYILGSSGTGKTTLLKHLALQDIRRGDGVFVMDPHGDLVDDLLQAIPTTRYNDIQLLDAGAMAKPFHLNMLDTRGREKGLESSKIVSELLAIFHKLYQANPEALGPMFEQYFTAGIKLLMVSDACEAPTLSDFVKVFADRRFLSELKAGCQDQTVLDLIEVCRTAQGEGSWSNVGPYITAKVNRITTNPLTRSILCAPRSTVDFQSAMDGGKIVLVKLPKGQVPEMDVRLLGLIIMGQFFLAAQSRAADPQSSRRTMYTYIDEFQNFVTETVGELLAEGRKYGIALTLANQSLSQVSQSLRDIVLGNASSLLSFRTGPEDGKAVEPFFQPIFTANDLQKLPNFSCAARILANGAPLHPQFVLEISD